MLEKALRLACKELSKEPDNPWRLHRCPYNDYEECVSDIHPVVCNDIREECWYKYFMNKANI